ncbi:BMP family ABC transporter substrate-binding protein [[Mycoplasma] mobile]|uniref:Unspecified sugar ABC transporter binding protein n=1 Tax=Mycoplasma mobile (strain ATCC 43663 / 163K / NCTC 11711) TaxID=267748 RepID=Q6KIQ4_MYCM1|nr:BMP family ABC transporter substrate-binding protein [[Mycoplasma] mobile]AAT27522.1 unspecified sugar ABC transporter binding protein [Mycoplasma mobile 163K]
MNKNTKKILIGSAIAATVAASVGIIFGATPRNTGLRVTDNQVFRDLVASREAEFATQRVANNSLFNSKTLLITAGGVVNDLSFNQSINEALLEIGRQTGKPGNFSFAETTAGTPDQLQRQYDQALFFNHKFWVLTGFQQDGAFQNWLQIGNNRAEFIRKQVIIVAIDWTTNLELVPPGQFISINYRTQESSWIVGNAVAKFISDNHNNNRTFNTFGGGAFPEVTNFNAGFLQGILDFNNSTFLEPGETSITDNKKLSFTPGDIININTGFAVTPEAATAIQSIVGSGTQVVFPVAGSLTTLTVNSISQENSGQFVIGVDSDQAKAFSPDLAKLFFSSVEKNVAGTTYAALASLYLGTVSTDPFFNITGSSSRFIPVTEKNNSSSLPLANADITKGFVESTEPVDFVGFSKSALGGKITQSLVQANVGRSFAEVADEYLAASLALFNKNKAKIIATIPVQIPNFSGGPSTPEQIPNPLNELIKKINFRRVAN